jgi:hypothetical protein
MLQSERHLRDTHPRFYLLTITYSVYACNNLMLKCSCFRRQSTIEHCLINRLIDINITKYSRYLDHIKLKRQYEGI